MKMRNLLICVALLPGLLIGEIGETAETKSPARISNGEFVLPLDSSLLDKNGEGVIGRLTVKWQQWQQAKEPFVEIASIWELDGIKVLDRHGKLRQFHLKQDVGDEWAPIPAKIGAKVRLVDVQLASRIKLAEGAKKDILVNQSENLWLVTDLGLPGRPFLAPANGPKVGIHGLNGPQRPGWDQLFRSAPKDATQFSAQSAKPVAAEVAKSVIGKGFSLSGHEIIKVDVDLSAVRIWLLGQESDSTELLQEIILQKERSAKTLAARRQELQKSRMEWREPAIGMEFVWVSAGCYLMGGDDSGFDNAKPAHEVCVDGFYIGKYETSQAQWLKVMGSNPAEFKKGGEYPIETVSWNDVQGFIKKFRVDSDINYRLPTEAEWEFAARSGGKDEKYAGGAEVGALAWYGEARKGGPHRVGAKRPNGLGLYDMSGNLWEWCQDWSDDNYYKLSPRDNPAGPLESWDLSRIVRGGSWEDGLLFLTAITRNRYKIHQAPLNTGFRLVISPVL